MEKFEIGEIDCSNHDIFLKTLKIQYNYAYEHSPISQPGTTDRLWRAVLMQRRECLLLLRQILLEFAVLQIQGNAQIDSSQVAQLLVLQWHVVRQFQIVRQLDTRLLLLRLLLLLVLRHFWRGLHVTWTKVRLMVGCIVIVLTLGFSKGQNNGLGTGSTCILYVGIVFIVICN